MVILVTRVIEMDDSSYTENANTRYRVPKFCNMSIKFFVKRHALCNFRDNDTIIHGVNNETERPQ